VVISPQVQRSKRETGNEPAVTFEVLRDQGNQVARRYGVVHELPPELQRIYATFNIDLPTINGDGSWTLPMPARLVIDRAGIVRAVDADPDYTHRSEPAETVKVLRELAR
jgi:peroxiredoxin